MSMLAEPKKKVKWGLNPRGNLWANDNSKFGQKLLEKMGWQMGKGLGKHENGRTDNIAVVTKEDNKGVGWDDKTSNWIAHQDDFNALLAELNKAQQNNSSSSADGKEGGPVNVRKELVSLEVRSKTLKSRVHYKKFVCGKDVSQYSAEDMEGIFGKKLMHTKDVHEKESEVSLEDVAVTTKESAPQKEFPSFDGVTYTSSASVSDYFALKMKNKNLENLGKKVEESLNLFGDQMTNDDDADEVMPSFACSASFIQNSRKSKKRKSAAIEESNQTSEIITPESTTTRPIEIVTLDAYPISPGRFPTQCDKIYGSTSQQFDCNSNQDNLLIDSDIEIPAKLHCANVAKKHKREKIKKEPHLEISDASEKCTVEVKTSSVTYTNSGMHCDAAVTGAEIHSVEDCSNHKNVSNQSGMEKKMKPCGLQHRNLVDSDLRKPALSKEAKSSVSKKLVSKPSQGNSDMQLLQKYHNFSQKSNSYAFQQNTENWIVTLNQARKLARYKDLHKKILSHKILSVTNLLSIPGYGVILGD